MHTPDPQKTDLAERTQSSGILARAGIGMIRMYQNYISPLLPPACRFNPTCSQYTLEAVQKYGFFRGSFMGFKRIGRCHPFHEGGYDPVP